MLSSFLLISKQTFSISDNGLTWHFILMLTHPGVSQQTKGKKDASFRPGRKRVKGRNPKVKDKEVGGKVQSILTQVLDKGRFLRLGDHIILSPGKTLELRCKGTKIGWAYPSYLDTFNDSRLRYFNYFTSFSTHSQVLDFGPSCDHIVLHVMNMSRTLV